MDPGAERGDPMNATQDLRHEFQFTSKDGLRIACTRWQTGEPARGVIQIAHGMGEHSGRYSELIAALQEAGLVVYANDHRGHGRTAGSPEHFGDFGKGGFDLLVDDIFELSRVAKKENPGKPFILFAHSMGSFAAQQYILDHSEFIDGLALSGSGILDGVAKRASSASPSNPNFLNAPFEPARTPFDWLSRDPRVADAFMNDPLCFATLQPASTGSSLPRLSGWLTRRPFPKYVPICRSMCFQAARTRLAWNWQEFAASSNATTRRASAISPTIFTKGPATKC